MGVTVESCQDGLLLHGEETAQDGSRRPIRGERYYIPDTSHAFCDLPSGGWVEIRYGTSLYREVTGNAQSTTIVDHVIPCAILDVFQSDQVGTKQYTLTNNDSWSCENINFGFRRETSDSAA